MRWVLFLVFGLLLTGCTGEDDFREKVDMALNDKEFVDDILKENDRFRIENEELAKTVERMRWEAESNEKSIVELQKQVVFVKKNSESPPSPKNELEHDQVVFFRDRVVISVDDAFGAVFIGTKSMEPLINKETTGIQVPLKDKKIRSGDIISFKSNSEIIIHRVLATGKDKDGWFAVTKGDNNPVPDPEKVRREDIIGLMIGMLY